MLQLIKKILKTGIVTEKYPAPKDDELESLGIQIKRHIDKKFSGSIAIRLRARAGALELSVTDNGAGLSAARRQEATGMGLQIMDYRARTIGGTIEFGPGPRGGTRVFCCVPAPVSGVSGA